MAWWLQLTQRSLQRLDMLILPDAPALLAAWQRSDRASFYRLDTGSLISESEWTFPTDPDRTSEAWAAFLATLKVPNSAFLPIVQTPAITIYTTPTGQTRLFQTATNLIIKSLDHPEVPLEIKSNAAFRLIHLTDPLLAALDQKGKLHLYRQTRRIGTYDIGIKLKPDSLADLAVTPTLILVSDSTQIVQVSFTGKVMRQLKTHYVIARMTASPNGRYLITSDLETGVLRIYDGQTLQVSYQRFAIDLISKAPKVQLLADIPPETMALSALTIDDQGTVAFAISGVICVAQLEEFDRLPSDQSDKSENTRSETS
ncbi:MAG: hypothetical protein MUF87_09170 [Anaerolineae bacterium]|jgi:WD40 repeat protein|nr:hypothetical protein [Anaerolineae bacterium]